MPYRITQQRNPAFGVAFDGRVQDMDGPFARLLGHTVQQGGHVGAPALVHLLQLVPRGGLDPGCTLRQVRGADGYVVPSGEGHNVDLCIRRRLE